MNTLVSYLSYIAAAKLFFLLFCFENVRDKNICYPRLKNKLTTQGILFN